jgi:hypothetical protein
MTTADEAKMDVFAHLQSWEDKAARVGMDATRARLDAWRARIEELRIRSHLAGLDARDEAAAPIARLEARFDRARDRLRELELETDDVWTALTAAYASARDELEAGVRLIGERVSAGS